MILLSLFLGGFGVYCLVGRVDPFRYYFYVTCWWAYIILTDTVLAIKTGRFTVLNRRLPLLVVISSAYWCMFELLNLRLRNWHYVNVPQETGLRYAGYLLSFGTVIPGILVTRDALALLVPGPRLSTSEHGSLRPRGYRYPIVAILSGLLGLILLLLFPLVAFPLAWGFFTLIADGYNYARGYRSFAEEWEGGRSADLVLAIAAGLICGFLWEAWNYGAASKWIYTVPFFTGMKVFEMPLAGYIGFLAFGIETMAFVYFLEGIRENRPLSRWLVFLSLLISFGSFPLIDRHTVLSFVPLLYY